MVMGLGSHPTLLAASNLFLLIDSWPSTAATWIVYLNFLTSWITLNSNNRSSNYKRLTLHVTLIAQAACLQEATGMSPGRSSVLTVPCTEGRSGQSQTEEGKRRRRFWHFAHNVPLGKIVNSLRSCAVVAYMKHCKSQCTLSSESNMPVNTAMPQRERGTIKSS